MKKNRFKLGVLFLLGLVGYFLALSAILVASAGLPEGGNSKTSGTPNFGKDIPKKTAGKTGSDDNSSDHQSGLPDPNVGWTEGGPCLSLKSSCGNLNSDENGPHGGNWGSGNGSSGPDGQGGFSGGQDFYHPASYGSPIYGSGGPAFGPHADFGGNGGNGGFGGNGAPFQGDGGGDPSGKHNPPFGSSMPDSDPPFPQLDPPLFTTNDVPDPQSPPVETAATTPVPEPATFWVFIASLATLVMAPRSLGRALRTRFDQRSG